MKKRPNALEHQIEAASRFNPRRLTEFLENRNGTACVDRSKILCNEEDERLFIITLACDYRSGYKNIDSLTVYFDVVGDRIIGGVYDLKEDRRVNGRNIAAPSFDPVVPYRYVYDEEVISLIKDRIRAAT